MLDKKKDRRESNAILISQIVIYVEKFHYKLRFSLIKEMSWTHSVCPGRLAISAVSQLFVDDLDVLYGFAT